MPFTLRLVPTFRLRPATWIERECKRGSKCMHANDKELSSSRLVAAVLQEHNYIHFVYIACRHAAKLELVEPLTLWDLSYMEVKM